MTYLLTLILGVVIGVLAQEAFDLLFKIDHLWRRFNEWRKG